MTPSFLNLTNMRSALLAGAVAACATGMASAQSAVTLSLVPTTTHSEAGQALDVRVHMHVAAQTPPSLIGAQVVLRFDATMLEPTGASTVAVVPDGPFPALNPGCVVDGVRGAVCFFVLDPTFSGAGGFSGDIATLHFRVKSGVESCAAASMVSFGEAEGLNSSIAALPPDNPAVAFVDLPAVNLDRTAPVLAGVPDSIALPADAGSAYGAAVAAPTVSATDACDPSVPVMLSIVLPNGSVLANWPAMFPVGTSTATWSATDDTGHSVSASRTVTVENHQMMDAVVHFEATFDRESLGFDRMIRFKTGSLVQVRPVSIDPIQRAGVVTDLQVPVAAAYGCVSAKDAGHSLTDTSPATVVGTRYAADFSLAFGDSNDDDLVDVVDFTYFVFDHGQAAGDGRSNFNADGFVNNEDFSYIAINFFRSGQSCGAFTGGAPKSSISVKELRRMGLGHLAVADCNRDGLVDQRDIQIYLATGGRPIEAASRNETPIR